MNYKNIIGTFSNPEAVICEPNFLKTLAPRELLSGFAEMVKHAVISDDLQPFYNLKTIDYKTITPYISQSIETKNRIVLQDWKEESLRKMLNFGHTIGHALESISLATNKPLLHGEAVALGMLAEAHLAGFYNQFDAVLFKNLKTIIEEHFHQCKFSFDNEEVVHNMLNDKKNEAGKIIISLPYPHQFIELDAKNDKEKIFEALRIIERAL